jgi:glycosyltransferase involved in cell wall biosynthesis
MRLLYASMMLPYPPTFGKRMEIWTSLRALRDNGYEVTLLSFGDSAQTDADRAAVLPMCEAVEVVPLNLTGRGPIRDYVSRLVALCRAEPYDASRFRSGAFQDRLLALLASGPYDAVVCGEVYLLENFPASVKVPIVLKKDHIASTLLERYCLNEKDPVKRMYARIEYRRTLRWEAAMCKRAAVIMACSEPEREVLQEMCPGLPVTVAPNVIDTAEYWTGGNADDSTILYQGQMDWSPNQDAVLFFVEEVLPLVRRSFPAVRFVVAGRSSSDTFRRRISRVPNVEYLGTVPDMRPVMERCSVCVVPLRIASGTRFKILEAAAMGKPVVSTRVGAEGLDFRDGIDLLLADSPEDFARCVCGLIGDSTRRSVMGASARQRVISKYSLPVLCRAFEDSLRMVAGSAASAGIERHSGTG